MDETLAGFVDLAKRVGVVFKGKKAAGAAASTWQAETAVEAFLQRTNLAGMQEMQLFAAFAQAQPLQVPDLLHPQQYLGRSLVW